MPRKYFNDGQEVVFGDHNDAQSLLEKEFYDRVIFEMLQKKENAFFGDGFKVSFVGPTDVNVQAGLGFQTDGTVGATEPQKRLQYRDAVTGLMLTAPHATLPRIDRVVAKAARVATVNEVRKYKATLVAAVTNQAFDVETDWESELLVVAGVPNAAPVAPATPAGYVSLAVLAVTAVTGLAGSGAVTDQRVLLPVGAEVFINTVGYNRLPAGATTSLASLFASIDAYLKNGYQEYTDYDVLGADPAAPGAAKMRLFHKGGVWYAKDNASVVTPLGSGGGGGGGGAWYPSPVAAPIEDDGSEIGEKVYLFAKDELDQKLTLFVKVPQGYIAGRPITMRLGRYSPSAAGDQSLRTTATLIRQNTDAITSVTNQRVDTDTLTNAAANRYREGSHEITSATGEINAVAVNPGDTIKVELTRPADTDAGDIRMIPSATEVTFS